MGASRLAAIAAAVLLVAGCGGGKSSSGPGAAGAVTGFTKAFGAGDGAKACELLTAEAQAAFLRRVQVLAPARDCPTAIRRVHDAAGTQVTGALAAGKVTAVKVNGDRATATLTAAGHSTAVYLAKQNGRWKLTVVPGIG